MADSWNCPERPLVFQRRRRLSSAGGDGSEFRDMLLNTVLETLRRAANVPTITVVH